jgi:hypothetical protein
MNTLQYRKKEIRKQPKIQEPITHVVFVTEDGKWVSTSNPIRAEGVQRILRKSHLDSALPASLAVIIISENDDVLFTLMGKVHGRNQFDIFLKEALASKAKADAEKLAAKETADA